VPCPQQLVGGASLQIEGEGCGRVIRGASAASLLRPALASAAPSFS